VHSDSSVLERHHLHSTFTLLSYEQFNIFKPLNDEDYRTVRALMIELVLATDLSKHFDVVKQLNDLCAVQGAKAWEAEQGPDDTEPWTSSFSKVDLGFVMKIAIKFADLGHVYKSNALHLQWTQRVTDEFFALGDYERANGMQISPMCDRERDTNLARSQMGFFRFVCVPFYSAIADLIDVNMHCFVQLQDNYRAWKWLKKSRRSLTGSADLIRGSSFQELQLRMYDGFAESAHRIVYAYSDKLSHLSENEAPVHTTILASGLVENEPKPLCVGGVWTRAELEAKEEDEILDHIERHGITMPGNASNDDRIAQLVGKDRDVYLRDRALIAFPQKQTMTAEVADPYIDVLPHSNFVWRREDGTFAVVHCWPVKYNDKFRKEFKCSLENPDESIFEPAAATEFLQAMVNLFGPDAAQVPILYVTRVTHNPNVAIVGTRASLVEYLSSNTELQQQMGVVKVWRDGFLSKVHSKGRSDRVKWFSIPPEGEHVIYVKAGFETMATVKPLELFTKDCVFGPPTNGPNTPES